MIELDENETYQNYPVPYSSDWIERQILFHKQLIQNGWPAYPGWGKKGCKGWKKHHTYGSSLPTIEETEARANSNHPNWGAPNTFFPCGNVCFLDLDFDTREGPVQDAYNFIRNKFEGKIPVLLGQRHRIKIPFKPDGPIKSFSETLLIEGGMHDIEVKGEKTGAAVYGVHPDTKRFYTWVTEDTPFNTHVDELIGLSQDDVEELVDDLADLFGGYADLTGGTGKSVKQRNRGVGGAGNASKIVYNEDGLACRGREAYTFKLSRQIVNAAVFDGCPVDSLEADELLDKAEAEFIQTAVLEKHWANQKVRRTKLRERLNTAIGYRKENDDITARMFSWVDLTRGDSNLNDNVLDVGDVEGVVWNLDGTAAETTLAWKFGIHRPDAGWPDVLGWHEGKGALVLKLDHDETPSALYVRFGAGVHNGSNLNDLTIERAGAIDAEFCKLPGNGRVIVCEGAIPALSVWVATGRAVWMSVQEPVAVADSIPDGAVLALDERPYRWNTLNDADKRKSIKGQLDTLRSAGRKLFPVHPQMERTHDFSTFADLYRVAGAKAVCERVTWATSATEGKATPPKSRAKEGARADLTAQVAGWGKGLKDGSAPDTMLLRSDAGTGKTTAFIDTIPATVREIKDRFDAKSGATDSNPCAIIAVRNHDDSVEVAEKFNAAYEGEIRTEVFRGREALNPATGEKMCLDTDAVAKASSELRNVQKTVCELCELKATCGYQAQLKKKADVWLVPHALIHTDSVPACIGDIRGIVVDEEPTGDWIEERTIALDALTNADIPVPIGPYGLELKEHRKALSDALSAQPFGPVARDPIREVFSTSKAERALTIERMRKLGDADTRDGLNAALSGVQYADNVTFKGFELLWSVILDGVAEEGGLMGRLSIEEATYEEGGGTIKTRVLKVRRRGGIKDAWLHPNGRQKRTPVLFTDATPTIPVLRDFHPDLIVHDTGRIETPHAKIYQDATRRYSKAMLDPNGGSSAKACKGQQNRLEVCAKAYETVLLSGGQGLITTNKSTREAMEEELPGVKGRFLFQHFNNVRGKDIYKHVSVHFDIGRTDPGKRVFEQEAGALTGTMPESAVGDGYGIADVIRYTPDGPVIDHNQNFNPNPLVQALHDRTVRSEGVQSMARCRPIDRTADNPASVYAFNDTVYETEVELIEDSWNPHPVFMSLAKHGLAVTNNATRASAAFPDLFETPRAYQYAEENASFGPEMAEFCGKSQVRSKTGGFNVTGIYILIPRASELRLFDLTLSRQGQKPFHVLIDTLAHEGRDPLDVIRERFGADAIIKEVHIDPNTGQPVTDLDQDAIREHAKGVITARGVSKSSVARSIDFDQSNFSKWLDGKRKRLPADALASLIDWMGVEATQKPQEGQSKPNTASATVKRKSRYTARANGVAMPSARSVSRRIEVGANAVVIPFKTKQEQTAQTWLLKADAQDKPFTGEPGAFWLKPSSPPWLENTNPFAHMFDLNKAPILSANNDDAFGEFFDLNQAPILEELKVEFSEEDFRMFGEC